MIAKWVYGMVICTDNNVTKYTWSKENFYLVNKPSKNRNVGYPLDSISVIPKLDKYFVDLTKEENEKYKKEEKFKDVIDFIMRSLEEL